MIGFGLPWLCCAAMGDEELYEVLTAVKGIGGSPCSVRVYLPCKAGP